MTGISFFNTPQSRQKSQAEVRERPRHHMETNLEIRKITPEETHAVTNLALTVFLEFEAPEYSAEGVRAFKAFLSDREMLSLFTIYGAFENGTPVGMLAVRDGVHISLFFVDGRHHRQGIGTALSVGSPSERRHRERGSVRVSLLPVFGI